MAIELNDLQFRKSTKSAGGVDNLGGAMLATSIGSQLFTQPTNLSTSVTITNAFNNSIGNGTLFLVVSGTKYLGWLPPGGSGYTLFPVTEDTTIVLGNSNGYIVVDVIYANLPGADTQDSITITRNFNNLWDDVLAAESLVGRIEYRCVYLENVSGTETGYSVTVYFNSAPSPDVGFIQLDAENTTTVELVDELDSTDVLIGAGLTNWSTPLSSGTGLSLGTMSPGEYWALWMKRVVSADTRQSNGADSFLLAISALVAP